MKVKDRYWEVENSIRFANPEKATRPLLCGPKVSEDGVRIRLWLRNLAEGTGAGGAIVLVGGDDLDEPLEPAEELGGVAAEVDQDIVMRQVADTVGQQNRRTRGQSIVGSRVGDEGQRGEGPQGHVETGQLLAVVAVDDGPVPGLANLAHQSTTVAEFVRHVEVEVDPGHRQ